MLLATVTSFYERCEGGSGEGVGVGGIKKLGHSGQKKQKKDCYRYRVICTCY